MPDLYDALQNAQLLESLKAYQEAADEVRTKLAAGRDADPEESERRQAAVDLAEGILGEVGELP